MGVENHFSNDQFEHQNVIGPFFHRNATYNSQFPSKTPFQIFKKNLP
jgi:hypothetical protein